MSKADSIEFSNAVKEASPLPKQQQDGTLLQSQQEAPPSGMAGEPMPYTMSSDWLITCILFFCFLLFSYTMKNGKKYIFQHFKHLFIHKERASLFDEASSSDSRYIAALNGISCILTGVCLFYYFSYHSPQLIQVVPHLLLLGIYVFSTLFYLLFKVGMYSFTNWIFFKKEQQRNWLQIYFDLWSGLCFFLFPLVLLAIYFNLSPLWVENIFIVLMVFAKILLFHKSIKNFFKYFHGSLHLILYFCALEIIPPLLIWEGIEIINCFLILKF